MNEAKFMEIMSGPVPALCAKQEFDTMKEQQEQTIKEIKYLVDKKGLCVDERI